MRNVVLALVLVAAFPAIAAEEFLTSAFRLTLPDEWKLKRGGQTSTLLEALKKPDCEMNGRLYENGDDFLSVSWQANQSFDDNSPNWGPITPFAAYDKALSLWGEKTQSRELTEVETIVPAVAPPILRLALLRGYMPRLKRHASYAALLHRDGILTIEMLTSHTKDHSMSQVGDLVEQVLRPASSVGVPACNFKGKGGPDLWRTW